MIVTLDARLFTHPYVSQLELLALIGLGFEARHALLVDPLYPGKEHTIEAWLQALPEVLREEVKLALEWGPEAASRRTAKAPHVRVAAVPQSTWNGTEPVLTPADALHLLRRPLKLLVENRRNDGAFLQKMLPPSYKQFFLEALDKGWLEIENGGGLGELRRRVESAWTRRDMIECGRMWVMFDSDARQAGAPSKEAQDFLDYCGKELLHPWPLHAHMLERRSIENYLPLKSLHGWAAIGGAGEREERRHKVNALAYLSKKPERRAHYNMKSGLLGDLSSERRDFYRKSKAVIDDAELPPLFQQLDLEVKRSLQEGFGPAISDLFHDRGGVERVTEEHLQAEIPDSERMVLSQSIVDRM